MQCILLLPDADGRLPSAEELRRLGFAVSDAVAGPEWPSAQVAESRPGLAQAAEPAAAYGPGGAGS